MAGDLPVANGASLYTSPLGVPAGFPEMLRKFTYTVLRDQPNNVALFGADYFSNMLAASGGSANDGLPEAKLQRHHEGGAGGFLRQPEVVEARLVQGFTELDVLSDGTVSNTGFVQVVRDPAFGLTKLQLRKIFSVVEQTEDCRVHWRAFVPIAVDLIGSFTVDPSKKEREEDEALDWQNVSAVRGMSHADVEAALHDTFMAVDGNGNGALSRKELRDFLRQSAISFTREEMNVILWEADQDGDGNVDFQEFLPLVWKLLVAMQMQGGDDEEARDESSPEYWASLVRDLARDLDPSGTGTVVRQHLVEALVKAGVGLTTHHAALALSGVDEDSDGSISYLNAAVSAGVWLKLWLEEDSGAARRNMAVTTQTVRDMDANHIKSVLGTAFSNQDLSGNGLLHRRFVGQVLFDCDLGLLPVEVNSILAHTPSTHSGDVKYAAVVENAFPLLAFVQTQTSD